MQLVESGSSAVGEEEMDAEMIGNALAAHFGLNACECNDMGEKDYSASYAMYNFIVVIIVLPFVAAFGIFSNFINCYIFTRPSMYSSVNIYLLALSCSDLLVVSTGVFVFYSDSVRVYFPSFTDVATQGIIWVLPLGFVAQTCSVYFTVAAAADCYVKVCWHPWSSYWCTPLKAKLASLAIAGFSIGYNALRFWQFQLNSCWDVLHNASNIEVCPTELYYEIGVIYNVYMYMVLMTVLPFMLLSFLNVLILRTVQRIRHMNRKLMAGLVISSPLIEKNGAGGAGGGSDGSKSPPMLVGDTYDLASGCDDGGDGVGTGNGGGAVMVLDATAQSSGGDDSVVTMVMVVILFLACNTLALIVNIVETFFDPDPLVVQYMTDTSNLLVVFNSSVNFVIYVFFDGVYRAEFKSCVECPWSSSCKRCRRVRIPSVYETGSLRNGQSPILHSNRRSNGHHHHHNNHRRKNSEEDDLVVPPRRGISDYLSVPTSPSIVQPPSSHTSLTNAISMTKPLARFRSLDDQDRDEMAMMPLMMSSDNIHQHQKRKTKTRLAQVDAISSP